MAIEIFENIPNEVKEQSKYVTDFIFYNLNPEQGLKFLSSYISSCENEEEQEFIKFYFNLRLEQLLNEGNND